MIYEGNNFVWIKTKRSGECLCGNWFNKGEQVLWQTGTYNIVHCPECPPPKPPEEPKPKPKPKRLKGWYVAKCDLCNGIGIEPGGLDHCYKCLGSCVMPVKR